MSRFVSFLLFGELKVKELREPVEVWEQNRVRHFLDNKYLRISYGKIFTHIYSKLKDEVRR